MDNNKELIAQCEERAKQWLTPAFDEETRKEVQAMLDNEDKSALIDAFYQNLGIRYRWSAWYYGRRYKPYE